MFSTQVNKDLSSYEINYSQYCNQHGKWKQEFIDLSQGKYLKAEKADASILIHCSVDNPLIYFTAKSFCTYNLNIV